MSYIRTIFTTLIFIVLLFPSIVMAQGATQELQTMISGLLDQVKALELKLSQAQNTPVREGGYILIRTLSQGSSGDDVKKLQEFLAKDPTLYPSKLVTGHFGVLTRQAVERFQIKYGIVSSGTSTTTGIGIVGPKTRLKLNELIKEELSIVIPPPTPSIPEGIGTTTELPPTETPVSAPAGEIAYVVNELDGTLSLIDIKTQAVIKTVKIADGGGTFSGILSLAVSPDKSRLYVTDYRADEVVVVRTSDMSVESKITVGDGPDRLAITLDGNKLYVANFLADTVSVIDTKTNTVSKVISIDKKPSDVTVSPDGKRVYVTHIYERGIISSASRLLVIDTMNDTVIDEVKLPPSTFSQKIVFTPDGKKAYISLPDSNAVAVIDTVSSMQTRTIQGMLKVNYMAMSPDGTTVFIVAATDDVPGTNFPSKIYLINTATDSIVRQLSGFNAPRGIAVTSDGSALYVVDRKEDVVKIVDLAVDTIVSTISVGDAPQGIVIK